MIDWFVAAYVAMMPAPMMPAGPVPADHVLVSVEHRATGEFTYELADVVRVNEIAIQLRNDCPWLEHHPDPRFSTIAMSLLMGFDETVMYCDGTVTRVWNGR